MLYRTDGKYFKCIKNGKNYAIKVVKCLNLVSLLEEYFSFNRSLLIGIDCIFRFAFSE